MVNNLKLNAAALGTVLYCLLAGSLIDQSGLAMEKSAINTALILLGLGIGLRWGTGGDYPSWFRIVGYPVAQILYCVLAGVSFEWRNYWLFAAFVALPLFLAYRLYQSLPEDPVGGADTTTT